MSLSTINSVSDYETNYGRRDIPGGEELLAYVDGVPSRLNNNNNSYNVNNVPPEEEIGDPPGEAGDDAGSQTGGQPHKQNRKGNDEKLKHYPGWSLLYRVFRTDSDFPGQRGLNPCCCFSFCCLETCSLRTGCLILAAILCVSGLSSLLSVLGELKFGLAFLTKEEAFIHDEFTNSSVMELEPQQVESVGEIVDYIFANPTIASLDAAGTTVFRFILGCFLGAAAWNLSAGCAIIASTLAIVAAVYYIVFWFMVTLVVIQADIPGLDTETKAVSLTLYSLIYNIYEFINGYIFLCAYAFYIQIRCGEYDRGVVVAVLRPKPAQTETDQGDSPTTS